METIRIGRATIVAYWVRVQSVAAILAVIVAAIQLWKEKVFEKKWRDATEKKLGSIIDQTVSTVTDTKLQALQSDLEALESSMTKKVDGLRAKMERQLKRQLEAAEANFRTAESKMTEEIVRGTAFDAAIETALRGHAAREAALQIRERKVETALRGRAAKDAALRARERALGRREQELEGRSREFQRQLVAYRPGSGPGLTVGAVPEGTRRRIPGGVHNPDHADQA